MLVADVWHGMCSGEGDLHSGRLRLSEAAEIRSGRSATSASRTLRIQPGRFLADKLQTGVPTVPSPVMPTRPSPTLNAKSYMITNYDKHVFLQPGVHDTVDAGDVTSQYLPRAWSSLRSQIPTAEHVGCAATRTHTRTWLAP